MAHSYKLRLQGVLALLGIALAIIFASMATSVTKADASYSAFCNNQTLVNPGYPSNFCSGASRVMYQVMGWGDQQPVCVSIAGAPGAHGLFLTCSGSKGTGVYTPTFGPTWAYPAISTNGPGANLVHGVVFQP